MSTVRVEGGRYFIQDSAGDGAFVWQQVDTGLQSSAQVWVRSPLLGSLIDALGQDQDGHRWLVMEEAGESLPGVNRLRDILLSSLALIFLLPLLLVVAVLIKVTSEGPVFYATTVVGKDRSQFTWYKLRSMRTPGKGENLAWRRARFQEYVEGKAPLGTAEQPSKVIEKDRVTSVGRFIRKFSIDELPQLWNVLRGQMSLVGPRPCLPYESEFYEDWRGGRFDVEAGLTGVWQVYGRGRVGFDEAVSMDLYYARRRSFLYDLHLMFRTVGVVITGRGAL